MVNTNALKVVGDNILELCKSDIRVFAFQCDEDLIVCSHAIAKGAVTKRAQSAAIERAEQVRRDFFRARAAGTIKWMKDNE